MARSAPARAPLPRLVRAADFEQALRQRSCASTPHFSMHHVSASVSSSIEARRGPAPDELSTESGRALSKPVDKHPASAVLGAVVPKRHARRAVTRNLLKRAIYATAERHREALAAGTWVLRLRAPFERLVFKSAASAALKRASLGELESLFSAATKVAS